LKNSVSSHKNKLVPLLLHNLTLAQTYFFVCFLQHNLFSQSCSETRTPERVLNREVGIYCTGICITVLFHLSGLQK